MLRKATVLGSPARSPRARWRPAVARVPPTTSAPRPGLRARAWRSSSPNACAPMACPTSPTRRPTLVAAFRSRQSAGAAGGTASPSTACSSTSAPRRSHTRWHACQKYQPPGPADQRCAARQDQAGGAEDGAVHAHARGPQLPRPAGRPSHPAVTGSPMRIGLGSVAGGGGRATPPRRPSSAR